MSTYSSSVPSAYREETANLLEGALSAMNDEGAHWHKGNYVSSYRRPDGKFAYCAVGALRHISSRQAERYYGYDPAAVRRACAALCEALGQKVQLPHDQVINWNDDEDTTWEQVKDTFERASALMRAT